MQYYFSLLLEHFNNTKKLFDKNMFCFEIKYLFKIKLSLFKFETNNYSIIIKNKSFDFETRKITFTRLRFSPILIFVKIKCSIS